jgi:two-component system OmpR family sensor kinase
MSRLFWKFFLAFWLTILLIVITAISVHWIRDNNNKPSEQQLDRHATVFINSAIAIAKYGEETTLYEFMLDLSEQHFPIIYMIDEQDNEILNRPIDAPLLQLVHDEYESKGERGDIQRIVTTSGKSWLVFAVRPDFKAIRQIDDAIQVIPPHMGSGPHTRAHSPHASNDNAGSATHKQGPMGTKPHRPLFISPLFWITMAIVISFIFSGLLAWYFTRPIRELHDAFSAVSTGDLTTRLSPSTLKRKDEFAQLGRHFDEMVSKLHNLITAQQNLLNDVSHELRSPLARMQAAIGIAQQQPEKSSATFERLETEIQQMSDLIGELLILSQVDTVENLHTKSDINFLELLSEIIDDGRYEATDKHIDIVFNHGHDISINGYEKLLRRAIENVVRNAIKFSNDNSTIQINVIKRDQLIELTVSDHGIGVNETTLPYIFDPFVHSDTKNKGGSGLGLAIAARAINKHAGQIKAQNNNEGGLTITIELPL